MVIYRDQSYLYWWWFLESERNIEWRTERAWVASVGLDPNKFIKPMH